MPLPISFSEKARAAKGAGGYPVQISAGDLDKNFVYAALEAEEGYIEASGGQGGHAGRRLTFPPIPDGEGPFTLTVENGQMAWGEGGGGGVVREYQVTINGSLYTEGFICSTDPQYPEAVT